MSNYFALLIISTIFLRFDLIVILISVFDLPSSKSFNALRMLLIDVLRVVACLAVIFFNLILSYSLMNLIL